MKRTDNIDRLFASRRVAAATAGPDTIIDWIKAYWGTASERERQWFALRFEMELMDVRLRVSARKFIFHFF